MPKYLQLYGSVEEDVAIVEKNEVILMPKRNPRGLLSWVFWKDLLFDILMPKGYPHAVSDDYLSYQIWDTVQALASSMNSALATEAVLRGAGVGNQNATAIAAAMAWLMKDGVGMVTKILFAWIQSPYLDAECKRWRLIADILNDAAFLLDLIAPFYSDVFIHIVCFSSTLRAVVGVAGGATRTTVTNHQAVANNVGDVAAKDGSQETFVNVTALICSLILLPLVSGHTLIIWLLFFAFTGIHLYANYRAVKSLHFKTLNRTLLSIIIREYSSSGKVMTVAEANDAEPALLKRGLTSYRNMGFVAMASSATVQDELFAAVHLEMMKMNERMPVGGEIDEFLDALKRAGWSTNSHRLVFDQWTFKQD